MSTRAKVRHSPFAIAAVVVALIALSRSVVQMQGPFPFLSLHDLWFFMSALVPPVGGALIALWLIAKGRKEVALHEGQLSGAMPLRVARIGAVLALVIAGSTTVFEVAFPERPIELNEDVLEVPEPPDIPSGPGAPAEPVAPNAPDVIFLD